VSDDLDRVLSKNPNAAFRVYEGQATVVLPDQAEVNVLNEIGSLVWSQIDGRRSLREIVAAVRDTYEVAPEEVQKDVLEFIASLQAHRMVR
jgi:Coenzyme PQQ synthesis protein D (PqqD)